jgi:hypothetical protein
MKSALIFIILLALSVASCSPEYKYPGQLEIRGFKIGDKVDTTQFQKYKPLYFPNYLDGWTMANYDKLPEEYARLPIAIWKSKNDTAVALNLLDNVIMKIIVSYVSETEKEQLSNMLNTKFDAEGKETSYEETHPLQAWITYWSLRTWETNDVIFQMGNSNMRKPEDPVPADLPWNLVYSDLILEKKIIEDYKSKNH